MDRENVVDGENQLESDRLGEQRTGARWCGLAALVLLAFVAACSAQEGTVTRVMEVLGADKLALSAETREELDRFNKVFVHYANTEEVSESLDYFRFAFRRVRAAYVKPVPDSKLIDAAISGLEQDKPEPGSLGPAKMTETALDAMLRSLDPHSDYMTSREFEESYISTKGEFGGLGIEVTMEEGLVKVVSPIEDTPAARAGIRSGDLITHVDGDLVKGKSLSDAVSVMRGKPGSEIVLRIRRAGVDDFDVTIVRAVIKVRSVRWRVEGDVGYVRVTRFTEKVESGIAKALAQVQTELGRDLKGIVLDLRSNPGGLLDQSLILADSFLDEGQIVSVRGRGKENRRDYQASPGDLALKLPMVVLIDGGSASASEIVASALQFHGRAIVMGRRSFGKGSVQTIMPLPLEGALRLTTALYYAPNGKTIQAEGVHPDIVISAEKPKKSRRERDLPGALAGEKEGRSSERPTIDEQACPAAGEQNDRLLGCAMFYLQAGSTERFLADMAARGKHSS